MAKDKLPSSSEDESGASGKQKDIEFNGMVVRSPGWKDPVSALRWSKFFLVATGIFWGLTMQLMFYEGGAHPLTALPNLDWYIGMMLVYSGRLFRARDTRYAQLRHKEMLPIGICDFIGTMGTTVGLDLAGSAIFGIIFSSVTVWSALFTCLILKKCQTKIKIAGIMLVVFGLALPCFDSSAGEHVDSDGDGDGTVDVNNDGVGEVSEVKWGILLTTLGTLFYGLEYCLCERMYSVYDKPSDSKALCFYTGAWGLFFTLVWMAFITIPRWEERIKPPAQSIACLRARALHVVSLNAAARDVGAGGRSW